MILIIIHLLDCRIFSTLIYINEYTLHTIIIRALVFCNLKRGYCGAAIFEGVCCLGITFRDRTFSAWIVRSIDSCQRITVP